MNYTIDDATRELTKAAEEVSRECLEKGVAVPNVVSGFLKMDCHLSAKYVLEFVIETLRSRKSLEDQVEQLTKEKTFIETLVARHEDRVVKALEHISDQLDSMEKR